MAVVGEVEAELEGGVSMGLAIELDLDNVFL